MLGRGLLEHLGSLSALPGQRQSGQEGRLGLAMPIGADPGPSGPGSLWMGEREVRCRHTHGLCNCTTSP